MACRLEDYALIGDCSTAALVGRNGSIDWLCWPRFDSDACFAALLGNKQNGRWLICPENSSRHSTRRYRPKTLILETRFETEEGAVLVIDFMPPRPQTSDLIRLVIGERGRVTMKTELIIRFGYGASTPWVSRLEDGALRAVAGPDMVVLRTPVALHGESMTTVGNFIVSAGEIIPFVLTYGPSQHPAPLPSNPRQALVDTENFWHDWAARCHAAGPWSEAVTRSLITLKALTYAPTGGIVAAPTTSLPEQVGGVRNWDYRYCWLRDATLTLFALMTAGYYEEAQAWRDWLLRAAAGSPDQMQIMYGIAGERRLIEWEISWLTGYERSKPVRVGNAAHSQLQLDVYGEVMDALHQARRGGLAESEAAWALECALLNHLEQIWRKPDEGIWEARSGPRHFTYSKVMAWVAVDRAVKDAETFGLAGPTDRWRALCKTIHDDVCRNGFNQHRYSFVRSYDSDELDASLLLLPQVGFLPPQDPRIQGTIKAIEANLLRDGFVLRYDTQKTNDGLPIGEGAFLACSFWLADAYILLGRHQDAERLFERLLSLRNDVGLLAEEYDPILHRQVGNFPQAFSHVALVNTAYNLASWTKPAAQRAAQEPALTGPAKLYPKT